MRNTLIFSGTSCPELTCKISENLGMLPADAELTQFSNGETSVRILTSVREKDVFIVQSGSPKINDTIMELLIMISACKGGSANKITAVLPYFPYSRQSKKKSHRSAITARMLANLLHIAGVEHVITVDLHASQMQGFFKCPVDNLHAEPLIARWIRQHVLNWQDAVVVSKNAGGTKRVTSLADALKLNFGIVTTDRRRNGNMSASMIMNHLDGYLRQPALERTVSSSHANPILEEGLDAPTPSAPLHRSSAPSRGQGSANRSLYVRPFASTSHPPIAETEDEDGETRGEGAGYSQTRDQANEQQYNDSRAAEVTHGRLVQGHIVSDDFPSPATSAADTSIPDEDPMMLSHASSFFSPEPHALGGSGDVVPSDDEEDVLTNPTVERMITLVGDVKNRPVFIVDDMIDKPGSWIAAAETVRKRGCANKVYCIATHAVFGGDCLEQLQACECIDQIVVTNSFPIDAERVRHASKLIVLDLSYLLSESIRRNHYGESIHPLFQHFAD